VLDVPGGAFVGLEDHHVATGRTDAHDGFEGLVIGTLNTYGHLWPSLGAQLDAKIEGVYRETRGQYGENVVQPPS
jgi:hypothetical protein